MSVRKMILLAAAGVAVLSSGACAAGTTTTASAAGTPAPLSSAWHTGTAAKPTVAPAQVAPGAYHPVAATTGAYLAIPSNTHTASPAASHSVRLPANCSPMLGPATSIPVTVTAGTGTITAHWTDLSDPAVLTYRVAAIPNNGAPTAWTTVATTHTCNTLTTTITGLAKGIHYEVWVDAVHTMVTYGISGVTQETMIGRSTAVTVR
ncbi:hypothetical protein [Actinoplanes sp. NPDC020271]|uniref:hypothetical protein n=1 Tax=Actinoplanes sp. NPDC020271 TaxID=3363896 RepID=UPI0037AB3578